VLTFGAPKVGGVNLNKFLISSSRSVRFQFQDERDKLAALPPMGIYSHEFASTYRFGMSPDSEVCKRWDWSSRLTNSAEFKHILRKQFFHCCYASAWFRFPLKKNHWPHILLSNRDCVQEKKLKPFKKLLQSETTTGGGAEDHSNNLGKESRKVKEMQLSNFFVSGVFLEAFSCQK
jgi:hypothetical protein